MGMIKTDGEIRIMREGGKRLSQVMKTLEENIKPGISTLQIDEIAEKLVSKFKGVPSFKGYGGGENPFPSTICASLNDEIVHGIPSKDIVLKEGDIFKIDIGMKFDGFHTDMARTFAVGRVKSERKKIIDVVKKSFHRGIKVMKEGANLNDYSREVQKYVEKKGFSVVRDLVGHGIGSELHEDPQIPNYADKRFHGMNLKSGMTFALEPMINSGGYEIVIGEDGWVFKTEDRSDSAHWENTVLVTKKGVEILTEY